MDETVDTGKFREIRAVHVRLLDNSVTQVTDTDLHTVEIMSDDSLNITDSDNGMIFYAPAGHWQYVYVEYVDGPVATPAPADAQG